MASPALSAPVRKLVTSLARSRADGLQFQEFLIRVYGGLAQSLLTFALRLVRRPFFPRRLPPSSIGLEMPLNGENKTQAGSLCYIAPLRRHFGCTAIALGMALRDRSTV